MYENEFNDGHNQESGMDDEPEYDSDEEEVNYYALDGHRN
jgi:hypothetical protein